MKPKPDALTSAVRLLQQSDRLTSDLRARLLRDHSESDVQEALDRLASWGFLDDERTQTLWADRATSAKSKGRHLMIAELVRRGLAIEEAETLVLARVSEESERERAQAMVARRRSEWKRPEQAARYLASRGFDEELVRTLVEELFPT